MFLDQSMRYGEDDAAEANDSPDSHFTEGQRNEETHAAALTMPAYKDLGGVSIVVFIGAFLNKHVQVGKHISLLNFIISERVFWSTLVHIVPRITSRFIHRNISNWC